MTVRALLDDLSLRVVDAALMEKAARQMTRLRDTDPDAWADYLAEGRAWEPWYRRRRRDHRGQ